MKENEILQANEALLQRYDSLNELPIEERLEQTKSLHSEILALTAEVATEVVHRILTGKLVLTDYQLREVRRICKRVGVKHRALYFDLSVVQKVQKVRKVRKTRKRAHRLSKAA